ncbi:MAG TPA: rRNA maturation RNase YbeY [Stellaceae bacterium]|nr:rRNA maturation RNase YbeY [Stellaceae bacterium]
MTDDPDRGDTLTIDIAEPCLLWHERLPDAARLCGETARAALGGAGGMAGTAELSIVLGDDALVQALNRQWRGLDKPTNVLSFPVALVALPPGAPRLLGDIVLAFETLAAEATAQGKPLAHHLRHLVVHGVLHLVGFDHEAAGEAARMEALEVAVLAGLGVPDPYRVTEASHG